MGGAHNDANSDTIESVAFRVVYSRGKSRERWKGLKLRRSRLIGHARHAPDEKASEKPLTRRNSMLERRKRSPVVSSRADEPVSVNTATVPPRCLQVNRSKGQQGQ